MSFLYKAFPQANWFYFSLYKTDQDKKKELYFSLSLSQMQCKWNKTDTYLQIFKIP